MAPASLLLLYIISPDKFLSLPVILLMALTFLGVDFHIFRLRTRLHLEKEKVLVCESRPARRRYGSSPTLTEARRGGL